MNSNFVANQSTKARSMTNSAGLLLALAAVVPLLALAAIERRARSLRTVLEY